MPSKTVEDAINYFFKGGPFDGKEKEGKWFASAKLRNSIYPNVKWFKWNLSDSNNAFRRL